MENKKRRGRILIFAIAIIFGILLLAPKLTTEDALEDNSKGDIEEVLIPTEEELLELEIDTILSEMTLEEKIYQLFIVTPEALTGESLVITAGESTKNSLQQYPVGGLIYFEKNLIDKEQTSEMLKNIMNYAYEVENLPLLLCIDEEGGRVARIANNMNFGVENIGAMQSITTKQEAYEAGFRIGEYLSELGFNLNFAPDTDVLTNSKNTVIGERSFGTDPERVATFGIAYSNGLHSKNVMSTFKHFPGHGATEGDSHEGFVYTDKTYEELQGAELVPFKAAEEAGVDVIMVAHISVPQILKDNTPCTLSKTMVTDILRGDLNYTGLIVTDALNMGAISKIYRSDEAAVKAILAGVDLLLMPEDFMLAVDGIKQAVADGAITEARINESMRRIIKAKLVYKN